MGISSFTAVPVITLLLAAFHASPQGGGNLQGTPTPSSICPFEGIIEAVLVRGDYRESCTYSVGSNMLRVARNETDHPYAVNLIERDTGRITLIFPHNLSFMRMEPPAMTSARPEDFPGMPTLIGELPEGIGPQADSFDMPFTAMPSDLPGMPNMPAQMEAGITIPPGGLPEGIGPQAGSCGIPHTAMPGIPNMPDATGLSGMPSDMGAGMQAPGMMPEPDGERAGRVYEGRGQSARRRRSRELLFSETGETTNLLGYACTRCELRQHDRVMEIWATDQLVPFHPWLQDPPPRHPGPQVMEEHWGELLQARKLFPLRIEVRNEEGHSVPFEFKVLSITPRQFDPEEKRFRPPPDYHELEPPPF